jgi:hypothetical protein
MNSKLVALCLTGSLAAPPSTEIFFSFPGAKNAEDLVGVLLESLSDEAFKDHEDRWSRSNWLLCRVVGCR